MTDRTILPGYAEQKMRSVSAARVMLEHFDGDKPIMLFNIPPMCLITDIRFVTEEAFQTGLSLNISEATHNVETGVTSVTKTLATQVASTSSSSLSAPQVKGTTYSVTETGRDAWTGAGGKGIALDPSIAPTQGQCVAVVEYIEYTRSAKTLTDYTTATANSA